MTAEERAFNVVNKNNIKTLQARAWSVLDYFRFQHIVMSEELLTAKIVEVLKDQIEDCAKIADAKHDQVMATSKEYEEKGDGESSLRMYSGAKAAAIVAREIRALAAPTEQTEGKEG